ncbi:MAG: TiaS agmantine-binding domain-containing protein [Candidatus Hodarchaeales archaeon]
MNLNDWAKMIPFHIAIDDTDSIKGMCTTYLGSLLYFQLSRASPLIKFSDFPQLIRLNPNIPFKTRGNGTVVIRGKISSSLISWFQSISLRLFHKLVQVTDPNTNPGLVICIGEIPPIVNDFAIRALWDVIPIFELERFHKYPNLYFYGLKLKQGLIGALSAIGSHILKQDHTFELLIYRSPPFSRSREANSNQIWIQQGKHPLVFNCTDLVNKTIMLFPRGPDPVFCGIRGENPDAVWTYWKSIQPQPKPAFWMIFRTNQGTNAHLNQTPLTSLNKKEKPYQVVNFSGEVNKEPEIHRGGHVSFILLNKEKKINCFAYEPTKQFRFEVLRLKTGDLVEVGGSLRPANENFPITLNIEQIKVLNLASHKQIRNPRCPKCLKRMKSAGKGQQYRCKKCKILKSKNEREYIETSRELRIQGLYLPVPSAQRHLTKPLLRYSGQSNDKRKIEVNLWLEKILIQKIQI